MAVAFLLRYQEECGAKDATLGTMTGTRTHTEQCDSDFDGRGHTALTREALHAGTMSSTGVATEQTDKDDTFVSLQMHMATKSVTNVRAEESDDDPGRIQNWIVPRCS